LSTFLLYHDLTLLYLLPALRAQLIIRNLYGTSQLCASETRNAPRNLAEQTLCMYYVWHGVPLISWNDANMNWFVFDQQYIHVNQEVCYLCNE